MPHRSRRGYLLTEKEFSQKKLYSAADYFFMRNVHANYEYGNENRLSHIIHEIQLRVKITKREIYEIGRLLVEAKDIVGHGNFQEWIKETFDFSYETAVNFMNVYKACLGNPHIVSTMKASVLYQISAPNFPADLRQYIFEHADIKAHDIDHALTLENIRNADIKELLTKYKAGELDCESEGVKEFFDDNKRKVQSYYLYDQIELCLKTLEKYKENISSVGGYYRSYGYDHAESTGQDPEVGNKIYGIVNAIDNFMNELARMGNEISSAP